MCSKLFNDLDAVDIQRGDIRYLVASWVGHSTVGDSGYASFFPVQECAAVYQLLVDL